MTKTCAESTSGRAVSCGGQVTVVDKQGQQSKKTAFYVRVANSTRELNDEQKAKYVPQRWPSA